MYLKKIMGLAFSLCLLSWEAFADFDVRLHSIIYTPRDVYVTAGGTSSLPIPLRYGETFIIKVGIENDGPDATPGLAVDDWLPGVSSFGFRDMTCPSEWTDERSFLPLGAVNCSTLRGLDKSELQYMKIVLVAEACGTYTNVARLQTLPADLDPTNNEVRNEFSITGCSGI